MPPVSSPGAGRVEGGPAGNDRRRRKPRQSLTPEDIEVLAPEIALTKSALEQAWKSVKDSAEIERLCKVGQLLGVFSQITNERTLPSS